MAKEIERRYLASIKEDAYDSVVMKLAIIVPRAALIKQGYFELTDPAKSFRVRLIDDFRLQTKALLTVKCGEGLVREELEKEIDLELGKKLLEISHHRLEKMRYYVGGWEIDVFQRPLSGIVLAEKEMDSPNESVELPPSLKYLFGEMREVTDSLSNLHLARLATDLRDVGIPALPFISQDLLSSVPCIAITGGPCSGKSSVMEILKTEFPDIHFVPEVASIIIGQVGILPSRDPVQNRAFQRAVYRVGKIFRTTSTEFAISQKKKAVVLDRGEADGAAYFAGGKDEFERVLGTKIKDEYRNISMVICLEVPPKDIYEQNKANNPARSETYAEAVALGERTRAAWDGHHNFHLVGNMGGWEAKVDKVRKLIKLAIK